MEEEMIEQEDPMQNVLDILGELQERYGISDDEINAVIDAVNVAFGADVEEPAPEEPMPEVPMEE